MSALPPGGSRRRRRVIRRGRRPRRPLWLAVAVVVLELLALAALEVLHRRHPAGLPLLLGKAVAVAERPQRTAAPGTPTPARAASAPIARATPRHDLAPAVASLIKPTPEAPPPRPARPTELPAALLPPAPTARPQAYPPPSEQLPGRRQLPAGGPPKGQAAIVIDDFGHHGELAEEMLRGLAGISAAILPHRSFSRRTAELAHELGHDVLLHLPLEPDSYPRDDPGPGVLFVGLPDRELRDGLWRDLAAVPHVQGVNNHMGSRFTRSSADTRRVLEELRAGGFFFLDSVTTADSLGYQLALEVGVPAARRDVFLDHVDEEGAIGARLDELGDQAMRGGQAIGIGHVRPATNRALRRGLPALLARGVAVVPLSDLLTRQAEGKSLASPQASR